MLGVLNVTVVRLGGLKIILGVFKVTMVTLGCIKVMLGYHGYV